jgi:endonuclease YncB( thermonuclease family)
LRIAEPVPQPAASFFPQQCIQRLGSDVEAASRGKNGLAKRNDIAPYERREARRWTRVADYWPDADAHLGNVHWPKPGTRREFPVTKRSDAPRRPSRRSLVLPVAAVLGAVALSIWGSGMLGGPKAPQSAATTSRGLVFGLCNEGGLTNCVASGDSFYLGGKTVRVAGIEAPQLYGAACPKEAALGRKSAVKLQALLNSGEIEMTKVGQDLDGYGLLLRNVAVDGKDVGGTLVAAGLAREIGDLTRSWC